MPSISLFGSAASLNVVVAFIFALVMVYLLFRLLLSPLRKAGKLFLRVGVAGAALILVNLVGARFGYAVPLNLVTVSLAAALGIPGFFLVTLMQFLLF